MSYHIIEDADPMQLAITLGNEICQRLTSATQKKSTASLVVSGGSTPKSLFEYLSSQDIAWDKVKITLADERCVSADDAANNGKMVQQLLLKNKADKATFISLYDEMIDKEKALEKARYKLNQIDLPYDVVILGMGNDGHTASIFPKASNCSEALDLSNSENSMLVDPITTSPLRITQTRRQLLNSDFLTLHFFGEDKRLLFNSIIAEDRANNYPISHFIYQNITPLYVYCNTTH